MADTFPSVISLAFMGALLVAGVALRARFALLQNALIPASLIGGLIGFVLISTDLSFGFQSSDYQAPAFHFFTLSFMSLILTGSGSADSVSASRGGWWMTMGWLVILVTQALLGLAVILLVNNLFGFELSEFLGLLAPHGLAQGPGQAVAVGAQWQNSFAIDNAIGFGLVYASVGFFGSFLLGVPVARYAIKRGLQSNKLAVLDTAYMSGIYTPDERPVAAYQVTHSASVDSLAYHLGLLGFAYLCTDQYLLLVQSVIGGVTLGGVPIDLIFSHNFFFVHGMLVCLLIRAVIDRAGWGHVIDAETKKRITGTAVDFMMLASILSVQFALISAYILPIALTTLVAVLVTATLCYVFSRKLGSLQPERALALFGIGVGTTGSGLLLLRMLDPDLSTTVAREIAFFNIAVLAAGLPILTIMVPVLPSLSLLSIVMIYGAYLLGAAGLWWWFARRT